MGGLGPGIGGMEYVVIGIVALLVVGPERLPALLHKLGKWVAKARNMANEFRASFDEMARQSELDDLRKEVEALRRGQTNMMPLGEDAEAAFKSISDDLNKPLLSPVTPASPVIGHDEWPDSAPVMAPLEPETPKPSAKARARKATGAAPAKAKASAKAKAKTPTAKSPTARTPRSPRKKAVEQ